MEDGRRHSPLEGLLLALVLIATGLAMQRPVQQELPPAARVSLGELRRNVPEVSLVALGGLVQASEKDPQVWRQLSGVGPVLAGRIARRAQHGCLKDPRDLLQVRGIGLKMAARLTPRIDWGVASVESRDRGVCR